jgi:hypothetical protein
MKGAHRVTALVLQSSLPDPPWLTPARWRLPGTMPLPLEDWIIRDDVFAEQMALRDDLIAHNRDAVHALMPDAIPAARECYDLVLDALRTDPGYRFGADHVTRPDGITVKLEPDAPLLTLGRLIQADLCLMESGPDGHVLTGAILCFPAYWTLSEKIGRPMIRIHRPVHEYDEDVARRVQRMFDALRPDRLLWRANANIHASGALFAPKRESDPERRVPQDAGKFVRSERQILRKLPKTGATVFSIHTYMVRIENLSDAARQELWRLSPSLR